MNEKLFRNSDGAIKPMLKDVEGISFDESPLDFFILLARYKFAGRLIDRTANVLDAGCGHGLGSVMLGKFAGTVTGVDVDKDLIDYCRDTYGHIKNLTFRVTDLRELSVLDRKFDSVVCMDVIEHFTRTDGPSVINSLAGALKDYGTLIIGTPNVRSQEFASQRRKMSHPFEYDYETFRKLLSDSFHRVFIFSMTDEIVSTGFSQLAWYFMAVCVK
jgi:2-polyprenyl-3-methyl-5-hydroxy-6-metoxy-1,4-benzoquinol methylase